MDYKLEYKQPYEYDDDSPSGIGDHSIGYSTGTVEFSAENDKQARGAVERFLSEGSIVFNHHTDGDGMTYRRRLVELTATRSVATQ